jgi:anti-sigma regulatory factor (Ser/Thr protein kinase)
MTISDWIKTRLSDLRSMIGTADDGHDAERGSVVETRTDERLVYTFKSSPRNLGRVRRAVEGFCDTTDLDVPAREEIGLVVNEAVANVMRHVYGNADDKPIELTAERFGSGVKIRIRDWGPGNEPPPHQPPDPHAMTPGGLGLLCIRQLMDEVKFVPRSDGMILELTRTTPGSLIAARSKDT